MIIEENADYVSQRNNFEPSWILDLPWLVKQNYTNKLFESNAMDKISKFPFLRGNFEYSVKLKSYHT